MPAHRCTRLHALLLLAAITAAGCRHATAPGDDVQPAAHAVTIMTFNVENLFDNVDDPGKVDETYLAVGDKQSAEHIAGCEQIERERWRDQCLYWDWSDEIVAKKLSVVADVILQVNDGRGPDIVALQEVENLRILDRLRREYLAKADYRAPILIEGNDTRGIDVAFLTRLALAEAPELHTIPFGGIDPAEAADTRGILEATFELPGGGLLTGYAVHFPAPYHPTEMREAAYRHLNRLRAALPDDRPAFAAGDFNTTSAEDREKSMLERFARPGWIVVHEHGCRRCKGTSYFPPRHDWSFLDMILWSPATARGEKATWQMRADSVAIANRIAAQVRKDGTPARFEMPGGRGVSDHWPLVFTIETK